MPSDFHPNDQQKFVAAFRNYAEKINSALEALNTHGEDSAQFAEAIKRAEEAKKEMSAIQGRR